MRQDVVPQLTELSGVTSWLLLQAPRGSVWNRMSSTKKQKTDFVKRHSMHLRLDDTGRRRVEHLANMYGIDRVAATRLAIKHLYDLTLVSGPQYLGNEDDD